MDRILVSCAHSCFDVYGLCDSPSYKFNLDPVHRIELAEGDAVNSSSVSRSHHCFPPLCLLKIQKMWDNYHLMFFLLRNYQDDYLDKISHTNFVLSLEWTIDIYKTIFSLSFLLQKVEFLPWKITNILNKYIEDLAKINLKLLAHDPIDFQLLPCFSKWASSLSTYSYHGVTVVLRQNPLMYNDVVSELGDSTGTAGETVAAIFQKFYSFIDKLLNNSNSWFFVATNMYNPVGKWTAIMGNIFKICHEVQFSIRTKHGCIVFLV